MTFGPLGDHVTNIFVPITFTFFNWHLKMTSRRLKLCGFLSLVFIIKSISKKLLIKIVKIVDTIMRPHFTPGDCKWFKTVPVPWTLKKIITMETENPTNLSDHSYAAITFHRSPTETKLMDRQSA